ncbi:MAG: hypothetical protein GXP58_00320 [Deltaproteobacteria bacterium]|nr:hypothetical protein [Deltaproteobacteria bacterium]
MSLTNDGRHSVRRNWKKTDLRQGKLNPQEMQTKRSRGKGVTPDFQEDPEALLLIPPEK